MIHVSITEAKANLSHYIDESATHDIIILRHSTPVAILISAERYNDLAERLEYLEDSLAAVEGLDDETVPFNPGNYG